MRAGLYGALTAAIRMQACLHRTGTAHYGAEQRAVCPEGAPGAALPRAWGGRPKLHVGEPAGARSEQHCIFTGAGTLSVLARLEIKRHWCQFRTAQYAAAAAECVRHSLSIFARNSSST